jgi:septum formation protein
MLILASASPRRRELLDTLGLPYIIIPSNAEEQVPPDTPPHKAAESIALCKARSVAATHPRDTVLAADTIVVVDGKIFGKPRSRAECEAMIAAYSGKTHEVITGVAIIKGEEIRCFSETTRVTFRTVTEEEIARYAATDEPYDKAGGYAVQGLAGIFIERIEGDYNNVVGLPLCRVYKELKTLGEQK